MVICKEVHLFFIYKQPVFLLILFQFSNFSENFFFLIFLIFIFFFSFHFTSISNQMKTTRSRTDIHIFYVCQMKDHEASITFKKKTQDQACLIFMSFALKKTTKKTFLLHLHAIILKRFHIVMHSYTALFSIRTLFYETNNIFYFKN